ncbi:MAG: ATP-binding protein [Spirochaetota bacterium]
MSAKVLIVEDEFAIATSIALSLKKKYNIIGVCSSGQEAITLCQESAPDLVLMDINIEGEIDGIDTAQELLRLDPNIAILYLTGETDPEIIDRVTKTEPFAYIVKPFQINELEFSIRISLYKKQIEKQLKQNEKELTLHRDNLELLVRERTRELEEANRQLELEVAQKQIQEKAYKQSEEKFRKIFEASPIGIIIFDLNNYQLIRCNPSFAYMLGYPSEKLLHMSLYDLTYTEDLVREQEFANELQGIAIDEHMSIQKRFLHSSGKIIWVNLKVTRYSYHKQTENDTSYFLGNVENITEMKQALVKEKEISELKSRFVSMASHEFRTPLSIILSSTEIVRLYRNKIETEKVNKYLDMIAGEVKNMTKLLDDVLLIGKINSTKITFTPTWIAVEPLFYKIVEKVNSTVPGGIEINLQIQIQQEQYFVDKTLLQQIATNLLTNAVKYSSKNDKVIFTVYGDDNNLVISIEDQGIGMTEEDQLRLFEPFYRGKNVGNVPGTGLGMAIVKNAVEVHSGEIKVSSELGRGSTFTVIVPSIEDKQIEEDTSY